MPIPFRSWAYVSTVAHHIISHLVSLWCVSDAAAAAAASIFFNHWIGRPLTESTLDEIHWKVQAELIMKFQYSWWFDAVSLHHSKCMYVEIIFGGENSFWNKIPFRLNWTDPFYSDESLNRHTSSMHAAIVNSFNSLAMPKTKKFKLLAFKMSIYTRSIYTNTFFLARILSHISWLHDSPVSFSFGLFTFFVKFTLDESCSDGDRSHIKINISQGVQHANMHTQWKPILSTAIFLQRCLWSHYCVSLNLKRSTIEA